MTSQPVSARTILALSIPALGSLAADPLLSLVDTAFVGRLGAVPLAALGVDTALFAFAFSIFNFLAYATTPMVAQARGRGDVPGSGVVVQRAMALALGLGVVSTAFLWFLAEPLVRLMQAGPEVVEPAVSYLRIRSFAIVALLIITSANGAYRGFKDTRTPLYVTLAVNGLNAVLDWWFIFGLGLGLEGAALATVAAQWIGAGVFVALLRGVAHRERWPRGRIRLIDLRPFVSVGSVLVLRTLLLMASLTIAAAAAARIGTIEVAAHQVVAQLWFLLAMIVDALAIAAQALVAELEGARDPHGVRVLSDRLLRWGVGVGVVLGLLIGFGGQAVAPLFSADPAVQQAIRSIVVIAAVMQPLAAWVFVADGVFLAKLRTALLAGSTASGLGALVVVLIVALPAGWGLVGVWWAMTAMVIGRAVVLGAAHYRPTFSKS